MFSITFNLLFLHLGIGGPSNISSLCPVDFMFQFMLWYSVCLLAVYVWQLIVLAIFTFMADIGNDCFWCKCFVGYNLVVFSKGHWNCTSLASMLSFLFCWIPKRHNHISKLILLCIIFVYVLFLFLIILICWHFC